MARLLGVIQRGFELTLSAGYLSERGLGEVTGVFTVLRYSGGEGGREVERGGGAPPHQARWILIRSSAIQIRLDGAGALPLEDDGIPPLI